MRDRTPLRVGVLAYDGCLGTEIFGIADLLLIANRIARALHAVPHDLFRVSVLARTNTPVAAAGGLQVGAVRWHTRLDSLVVPGFALGSPEELDYELARWRPECIFIASAFDRGVPVASVCVGAFLLGEAGALDGRRATTAWLYARQLADRYHRAAVSADLLMVSDRGVTTTAAFSAVHDLALRFIRGHGGDELARLTARVALVADNRTSQAPYVEPSLIPVPGARFAHAVRRWLVDRQTEPYDLAALSRAFHVSTRTMLRRFGQEAGQSPLEFLQEARVNAAKRLLESTDAKVTDVMQQVGYRDAGAFRRLFAQHVGVTPGVYRRGFRTPA